MVGSEPTDRLHFQEHWLNGVHKVKSPNCDARPNPDDISLIIVHGISLPPGRFGGPHIEELFTNRLDPKQDPYFDKIKELRVSSHFLIRRDGEIVQFVPVSLRAWHAGQSTFNGRERCNDFSVGIELEGTDDRPYEDFQYRSLSTLVANLLIEYRTLTPTAICGHSDVAPGRKTDPGLYFDWEKFHSLLMLKKLDA